MTRKHLRAAGIRARRERCASPVWIRSEALPEGGVEGRSQPVGWPVAALGLVLTSAGASSAAEPEKFGPFADSYSFTFSCGDSDASLTGTSTTTYRRFVDADGNPVRIQQFVSAPADVMVNLDTGKTATISAHFVQTYDWVAGTVTVTGFRYLAAGSGRGVTLKDAGRIIFADETEESVLFTAGRHDTATPELLGPALCGTVS